MKEKKSLLSFVIDSFKNDTRAQMVVISFFGFMLFAYYAAKSTFMLIEEADNFPDGYTISCIVMMILLFLGICLTVHTISRDSPIILKAIKTRYYSYLYIWYSDEILKLYKVNSDIRDKIGDLLKIRIQESELSFYTVMSVSWRKQDSYIKHLFVEEKYEELALLKKADDTRVEFERTNNFELLKNSAEEARIEIERLQNAVEEIDRKILDLQKKEEIIYQKLGLKK